MNGMLSDRTAFEDWLRMASEQPRQFEAETRSCFDMRQQTKELQAIFVSHPPLSESGPKLMCGKGSHHCFLWKLNSLRTLFVKMIENLVQIIC